MHDYLELETQAKQMGYVVDKSREAYNGYSFIINNVHVWKCVVNVGGGRKIVWNVKQLKDGRFIKDGQKHHETLLEALNYGVELSKQTEEK